MNAPVNELLTADELAKRLKLSPHTIRLWSTDGKIPTVWLSRTVRRFDLAAVLATLRQCSHSRSPTQNGGGR